MVNPSYEMKENFHSQNQKRAVIFFDFKSSTNLQCPLCHHSDSALHILSGCLHQTISSMLTERHNIA